MVECGRNQRAERLAHFANSYLEWVAVTKGPVKAGEQPSLLEVMAREALATTGPQYAPDAPSEVDQAIAKVLEGFDLGIFIRSTDGDADPKWAMRLLPYIAALGKLAALASEPSAERNEQESDDAEDAQEYAMSETENNTRRSKMNDRIETIASVCHETNRAYCITLGDTSQSAWDDAPEWQRQSAVHGVEFHLAHPDAGPDASHRNWLEEKAADGWVYGATKNPETKEHPCMVPFDQLPTEQQAKDKLFKAIVDALR